MTQEFHGGGGGLGWQRNLFHVSLFGDDIYLRCQLWKAFTITTFHLDKVDHFHGFQCQC